MPRLHTEYRETYSRNYPSFKLNSPKLNSKFLIIKNFNFKVEYSTSCFKDYWLIIPFLPMNYNYLKKFVINMKAKSEIEIMQMNI